MPLYEYVCNDCGVFREMVRMADCALDQPCPSCGAQAQRMLSTPFFADSGDAAPARRAQGAAGSWRHMCGFGCRCAASG